MFLQGSMITDGQVFYSHSQEDFSMILNPCNIKKGEKKPKPLFTLDKKLSISVGWQPRKPEVSWTASKEARPAG